MLDLQDKLIWSCSSFLVVPMSNALAQVRACEPDAAMPGQFVLMMAPEVQCFTGWHSVLWTAIVLVAPLFFFLLFPYALVHGDVQYVQRAELLSLEEWKKNAIRKATIFHFGPLHQRAENIFASICSELSAKIVLPIVVTLTRGAPFKQMKIVMFINVLLLLATLIWNPMLERSFNAILVGLRLWVVCMIACACMACILNSPERPEPLYAVCGSSVFVFAMTLLYVLKYAKPIHDHVETVRISTSDAHPVREGPGVNARRDSDGQYSD